MRNISKDLADLRREYRIQPLRRADLDDDPFAQFARWFDEASAAEAMDANAMSLASAAPDGQPSLRTVLLKSFDRDGFVFYTNLASRKAQEIDTNPRIALLFYWHELHRQIKITGTAERVDDAENRRYFARRPRDSQIGAWASRQSQPIASRTELEHEFRKLTQRYASVEVPLPDFWGGYRVAPDALEFWQGREGRLHDRFMYRRSGTEWGITRLAP